MNTTEDFPCCIESFDAFTVDIQNVHMLINAQPTKCKQCNRLTNKPIIWTFCEISLHVTTIEFLIFALSNILVVATNRFGESLSIESKLIGKRLNGICSTNKNPLFSEFLFKS